METDIHCKHSELVDPKTLTDHPKNANRHPRQQVIALSESIKAYGWRHPIVISRQSGYIVAGHGRRDAAMHLKMETVPVDYQDFADASEELAVLMADNIIPELAELDDEIVKANKELLQAAEVDLLGVGFVGEDDLGDISLLDEQESSIDTDDSVYDLKEGVVFPSSNKWGIPDLISEQLYDSKIVPSKVWTKKEGIQKDYTGYMMLYGADKLPDDCSGAILGFYVDDYRFEKVWYDAVESVRELKSRNFAAIIEPDFSVWRDDPRVCQMWNRYRAQWVARYWQGVGVNVIPSLNWSDERSYDFCLAGVPKNAKVVSIQARTTKDRLGRAYFVSGINKTLGELTPETVILYGGQSCKEWLEPNLKTDADLVWLSDFRTTMKEKQNEN